MARSIPEPKERLEGRVFSICGHSGLWECARFIYAKFARNARFAHIGSLAIVKNDKHEEPGKTKYLFTNDLSLTNREIVLRYRSRWHVDTYHIRGTDKPNQDKNSLYDGRSNPWYYWIYKRCVTTAGCYNTGFTERGAGSYQWTAGHWRRCAFGPVASG